MFKLIFRAWLLLRVFSLARRLFALATIAALLTSVGGCGAGRAIVGAAEDALSSKANAAQGGGDRYTRLANSPGKALGPVTKRSHCHLRGPLPDRACSPGAILPSVTTRDICRRGFTRKIRNVSYAKKTRVYAEYGMTHRFNGRDGEVDHIVPLEAGGSNALSNLYPEAASPSPGAHEKDDLENKLNELVCDGQMKLRVAQKAIARDWVAEYHRQFG